MKQSFTYYITLFIIKLKGLKKDFSQDPIDYKKIRKEDVREVKGTFFKKHQTRTFTILNTSITEITSNKASGKLVLFIHGGAFISGPAKHHWDTIKTIVKQTNHTVWMCDYPKAPEHKISLISQNIDEVYNIALKTYSAHQISCIGDSVGGTLITALVQRLVQKDMELPAKIILVSPVMDATLSNPDIEKIDPRDPMLSKKGVLSAKQMCAEDKDLKNTMISPLYGSFENFPHTILYAATYDITYPDQKLTIEKLIKTNTQVAIIEGEKMPHIWPFLPVMQEAKRALKQIIDSLNE
ncbi:esterase [Dokdonia pacifica]|uniref:Acetyl esterase/lipase n=1 Tax=Dokdonia pacifica TaxID=1627892 RepID=A0A238VS13_9FLAO|nr:alpha/beta hydrolase [Dokdonia pacifica]GGG18173.1 esterase [Dokdonia pacifica]SNR37120.1 Acetyl esterase/lipase [Dokdonia pacifica]